MPKRIVLHRRKSGPIRSLNRTVAILRPKQPLLDWLHASPGPDLKLSLDDLRQGDNLALLVPEFDYLDDAREFILHNSELIFALELEGWFTDPKLWPPNRTREMFLEWFDVELHSMVVDIGSQPLSTEPW
jgi:hypothetical protein